MSAHPYIAGAHLLNEVSKEYVANDPLLMTFEDNFNGTDHTFWITVADHDEWIEFIAQSKSEDLY